MEKAAAIDDGVPNPPAAPILIGRLYPFSDEISSLIKRIVGNSAVNGRLSVCPPESASTVISSETGILAANAASV